MNQKKTAEIESHLCDKLKRLPFKNRKQMDKVFKFASLVIRNKETGFYVIDDSVKGHFCDKALKCANALEKIKTSSSFEDIEKIREIALMQKEIETKMEDLIKKTKEIK
ncbi:hypothetical protein [Caminibacter sp.]